MKPVFGALADHTGAKPVMAGGLVIFAAASAAFVISGDPHLLRAARFAQRAGAAAFSPAAGELVPMTTSPASLAGAAPATRRLRMSRPG